MLGYIRYGLAEIDNINTMSEVIDKAVNTSSIVLTDDAVAQLKRIMNEQNVPEEYGLRVGVKGGGCSGFSYVLGFDVQKEKDTVTYSNGIKVFMEKSHGIYLLGMEVDWLNGLNNRGFAFNNPNASESCGCGTSFNA